MTTENQLQHSKSAEAVCDVRAPNDLSAREREQMYRLMADYYQNVERPDFERDLAEKEWVIVMSDASRRVVGFTTVARLRARCHAEEVVALYSGDTVLDLDSWGAGGWVRCWGQLAASIMHDMHPQPLYWLLLTATHRTYRFLPAFFKEYYPRPEAATTPIYRERLEALVQQKFPNEYDPSRGVVCTNRPMWVRQEFVDKAATGTTEKHAAFFVERNPRYLQGDYLVCITDLSYANRTRLGHKLFALKET